MTSSLRIGLLTPGWPGRNTPNGIATAVYYLAQGLREIGHVPVIIPMRQDGEGPGDFPIVPVPELPWSLMSRLRSRLGDRDVTEEHIAHQISAAVRLAMRDHGLNLFIMEETQGWARLVREKTGIPVVIALHGPTALLRHHSRPDESTARHLHLREVRERRAFADASALIAPSRHVLEGIEAQAPVSGIPRTVLPNSYRAQQPYPPPATLEPRDILFVGRFDYLKGGDTVLEAFANLVRTHPEAKLTFVGPDRGILQSDGAMLSIMQVLTALPPEVQARVTYMGPASREQVTELRSSHAIALIASRYENLNYTLLEAMAAGQAIVSTTVGGPLEVLQDGHTALMVPPGKAEAMAGALRRLMEDGSLTQRLGHAAVEIVQRDFAPAEIARRTVDFVRMHIAAK